MNKICAVIPMYGLNELTDKCVNLVLENAGMEIDIVVVDDGSPIPYQENPTNSCRVKVLRLEQNSGYTNATNQGILWCGDRYKYIHLLNNDIIPHKDFIKLLYEFMEEDYVTGIASSVRLNKMDGKFITELWGVDLIRGYQAILNGWENDLPPATCDWLPICSSLVRLDMIREIGLLDKRFRNHCSDSDYCIRANMNKWNVTVVPSSKVEHTHQTTTKTLNVIPDIDQKLFIEKLAGVQYQQLMNKMPLDCSSNTWGKIEFSTYKK